MARDRTARFFYAVATTGVFCRPSCKSRRPLQSNVRFFATVEEAQAAGFRPCKRCHPPTLHRRSPLDEVRAFLERNLDRPVRLGQLGRLAKLSPFTVQRLSNRKWASVLCNIRKRCGQQPAQCVASRRDGDERNLRKQDSAPRAAAMKARSSA